MKPPIRNRSRKTLLPAFAAAILFATGAASALPLYTITDLGDLPGGADEVMPLTSLPLASMTAARWWGLAVPQPAFGEFCGTAA